MNALMTRIFASLELEQQLAIQALEERGLVWGTHFTSATAERVLAEVECAFAEGRLYEWMERGRGR